MSATADKTRSKTLEPPIKSAFPGVNSWRSKFASLARTRLFSSIAAIISTLLLLGASSILLFLYPQHGGKIATLQLLLFGIGMVIIVQMLYRVYVNLVKPLNHMRVWAHQVARGDLSARIPLPPAGEIARLVDDMNSLSEELQQLNTDMDARVRMQTQRLAQNTRSLEILYDVAASINASRDLDDLLDRFLNTMSEVTDARAAAVRLVTPDNQFKLVSSIGLDDEVVALEQVTSIDCCLCGKVLQSGEASCQKDISDCEKVIGRPIFNSSEVEMLAVPMIYRDRQLGVFNLFLDKAGLGITADTRELLTSIGRHLGMAVDKAQLEKRSHRLSIIQERTLLAHELHDSLAQTIASMRFQIKVLDETLQQGDAYLARKELHRIKNSVDEAHTELRELLAQFRAPVDERGLVPALEALIERFRQETKLHIFLQQQCNEESLPAALELQVLRIIQESLVNIRKHAEANTVRVLLRCDNSNDYTVLIEDDGIGIGNRILGGEGHPGEHVGLSIMQERAHRLGGELRIESEPGEGTRVELTFQYRPDTSAINQMGL
jgi:two-component system nitrate/nitrite sensor histidine kinase NarX